MTDLPPSTDNRGDQPPAPTQSDYNDASSGLEDQLAAQQTNDQSSGGVGPSDTSERAGAGTQTPSDISSGLEKQLAAQLADRALDMNNPSPSPEQRAANVEKAENQNTRDQAQNAASAETAKRAAENRARDDAAIATLAKQAEAAHDATVEKAKGHH